MLRRRHEHRHRERSRTSESACRSNDDCGSTTSTPSCSTSPRIASAIRRIRAGRDDVERVAEKTPDRVLVHVGADDAHRALAVLVQRANQARAPGRARRAEQDRRHERSIRSFARCSSHSPCFAADHRVHRLAHRRAVVDPDLGMHEQLQPLEGSGAQLVVRAALAPVLVRVGAVLALREPRRLHDVDEAAHRLVHVLGIGVVPGDDRVEPVVARRARIHRVQADGVTEARAARAMSRVPAPS